MCKLFTGSFFRKLFSTKIKPCRLYSANYTTVVVDVAAAIRYMRAWIRFGRQSHSISALLSYGKLVN